MTLLQNVSNNMAGDVGLGEVSAVVLESGFHGEEYDGIRDFHWMMPQGELILRPKTGEWLLFEAGWPGTLPVHLTLRCGEEEKQFTVINGWTRVAFDVSSYGGSACRITLCTDARFYADNDARILSLMLGGIHLAPFSANTLCFEDYSYNPSRMTWDDMPNGNIYEKIIAKNNNSYFELLRYCSSLIDEFDKISIEAHNDDIEPFWGNPSFAPFDAITLYALLVKNNPSIYLEIGSGNSTKFARLAIKNHNLRTKIISIDPQPRAEIDKICDETIRLPCQISSSETFTQLKAGDMLFIDNSHRAFQNSDVVFFFTKILPVLRTGVIYGIHDINLPYDYPEEWLTRFFNEQYLLMAYLLGGSSGDTILFPVSYMTCRYEIQKEFPRHPWGEALHGCAFWMSKA